MESECSVRVVVPSLPDCMDSTQSKLGYEGKSPRSSIKFKSNLDLGGIWQLRRVGPPSTVANSASLIRLKEDGKVTIGRGPAADYFLDSAITLRLISRIHASIIGEKQANGWPKFTIVNSGLNGTYINDIKMGFHSENKQILQKGDKITFGHPGCASIQPGHYAPQHDSEFQFILEYVSPQQDGESDKLKTHVHNLKCNKSFGQSLQHKLQSVITGENCRTPIFVPNGHCGIESISQLADSPHSNASTSEKENDLANSGNEDTKPILSTSLDCAILPSSSCKQRPLNEGWSNQSDTHSQSVDQKLLISSGSLPARDVESSMAQTKAHNVKMNGTISEDSSQSSIFNELMHMSPSAYRTDGGGVEINSTTIILRDEDSDEGSHSPEIEIVGTLSPNLPTRIKVESGYDDSEAEDVTQAIKAAGKSSQAVHTIATHQDKTKYESPAESMLEKRSFLTPTDYRIITKNHLHNASVSPSDSASHSCQSVEHHKAPSPSSSPTSVSPPTLSPQSPFVRSSPQHCSHLQGNTNPLSSCSTLHSSDSESSHSSHTTSSLSSSKQSSPTSRTSSRSSHSHTSASLKEPLVRDLVPNMYSSSDEDEIFKENKTNEIVKKIYKSPNKRREAGKSCQVSRRSVLFKSNKHTIDSLKRCTSPLSPSAHNLSSSKILHRRKMNKSDESPSSSDLSDLESVIERDRTGSSYVKLKPKVTLKSLDYSPTSGDSTSTITLNPKSQPTPTPKSQPAPAPKSQPAPAPKSQPTPAPKSQLAPAPKSQPAPAPKSQTEPAPKSQPAPAPKSQLAPGPKSQTEPAPKSQPAPAPKSQVTVPLSKNAFALNSKESPSIRGKATANKSKPHHSVSSAMPFEPKDLDLSDNKQATKPSADQQKSKAPSAISASHPRAHKLKEKPEPVKLTSSNHNSSLSSPKLSPPSSVPPLAKGSTKAATPGTLAKPNLKPANESSLISKKLQSPIVISSSSDISVKEVTSDKKVANKSMYLIDLPLSDSPPLARKPSRTSKKNKISDLTNNKLDTSSAPVKSKTSNITDKGKQKTKSSSQSKQSVGQKRKSEDDVDLSTRKKHISILPNTADSSKKTSESGRLSRNSSTSSATSEMSKKKKRGPKKGKSDLVKKRKQADSTSDDDSLFDDERDEDWDLPDGVQYYDNLCSAKKCLNPTGTKVDWVMCDNCEQWYHVECVDCSIEVIQKENVQFHCGLC